MCKILTLYIHIILVVLGLVRTLPANNTLRIVGGKDANITDYPYQVSVQFHGAHGCGGSILNQNFVLTAAHCTYDTIASAVSVRTSSSFRNTDGYQYYVQVLYVHPNFDEVTYDFDISILKMASPIAFNAGAQPITLATAGTEIIDGLSAVATGWGLTSDNGRPADQLQMVILPTIITEECRYLYPTDLVSERMFCAGYDAGGKDTCQGDSGGPVVVSGIQIGITSWGKVCGEAHNPGVYTKISKFRDYIDNIVTKNS